MELFSVSKTACEIYSEKKNPTYKNIILNKKQQFIGKLTIKYLGMRFFSNQMCFVNNYTDFIIFDDFPYLKSVDDESRLFLLKLNKLYELKKYKMFFIPITSKKFKNDKVCFIFNENADLDKLILLAFLISINKYKNTYKNIYVIEEYINILNSIILSNEYQFQNKENKWKIFNGYLRNNIYESVIKNSGKVLTRKNLEKTIENYFNKLKKNDPKYLPTIEKEFDLVFNSFLDKIKSIQKTTEYKKFHADCIKSVAPYVFPMKKYFGKDRNIQYECFNKLVQDFEKEWEEYKSLELK
jgi:hypothetical protein